MVKPSEAGSAATAFGEIGDNSTPRMDTVNFRQRWQAILDSLRTLEEVAGRDVPSAKPEDDLGLDSTSGAAPAVGLRTGNRRDANGFSESSPWTSRSSDVTAATHRKASHALPLRVIPSGSDADQAPLKSNVGNSTFRLRKQSAGNNGHAKTEPTPNSITTALAASSESPVALRIVQSPVLPSQAGKDPGQASFVPGVQHRAATPASGASDNPAAPAIDALADTPEVDRSSFAAVPDAEQDDTPSLAGRRSSLLSRRSDDKDGNPNQVVLQGLEKPALAQAAPSTSSPYSSTSNDQSASGSALTMQTHHPPDVSRDSVPEQRSSAGAQAAGALKPEVSQRERVRVREMSATSRSKLATGILPIEIAAPSAGIEDAHGGQIAPAPTTWNALPSDSGGTGSHLHPIAPPEPFAVIDAGDNIAAKWVLAAGHRAEAGFQDPSLGWVSVRAQAGTGGIHAAVIPSSDAAAQVLGGHLAGLNAHIASQYEHLNPVTLSTSDAGWQNRDRGRETAQENREDARHDGAQQQMQDDPASARTGPVAHSAQSLREEPRVGAQMQTAAADPKDGHVSFIV
jgi:hypothetical protein